MFIKQVSVFLENVPGTMRELTYLLGSNGIDLMALSVADTQNFGIVRIIVSSDQIDPALKVLRDAGFTARVNNVFCAEVEDRPLGLCKLLDTIKETGKSVEYLYSFIRSTGVHALIVLRLSEQDGIAEQLLASGVRLYSQEEIDSL